MKLLPAPPSPKLLTAGEDSWTTPWMEIPRVMLTYTYYDLDTDHPRMVARIGKTILWEGPAQVVFMKPINVPWRRDG